MNKRYSSFELDTIRGLIAKYGHLTYINASALENEYFLLTGVYRAGGALYMCAWRIENGYYN